MNDRKMTLIFSSDLKLLEVCKTTYENFLKMKDINDEDFTYWSWVAIHEALVNAVKHGNKMDPEQSVIFDITLSDSEICVSVTDTGNGFEPTQVKDPTAPENLMKANGRGLLFIENIMNSVETVKHKDSFEIIMKKKLEENTHDGDK